MIAVRVSASIRFSIPISSFEPKGLSVAWRKVAACAAMRAFIAAFTKHSEHISPHSL